MEKIIKFGIGFGTGRSNVCKIINNTYERLVNQLERANQKVELTIYILFDLGYQDTKREDFYDIEPNVYKNINIRYITPEDLEEEKKKLVAKELFKKADVDLILGHGHAKCRNSIMYFAKKEGIDYLLFWDDDEYPVACTKENGIINWKEQDNILMHLKYIENADITIGYHCGYISPIPYVELNEDVDEENFKCYIEALGNELISWESIKEIFVNDNGVTYANSSIANGEGTYEIKSDGDLKWVAGSTLCVNLNNIDKIPAFYSPEGARGEDTFFSTRLNEAKVLKIPVYHFHDGFLKYCNILKRNYPEKLRKIKSSEEQIENRFLSASRGWIKYKPLFEYIINQKNYKDIMKKVYESLEKGVPEINKLFKDNKFNILLEDLKEYNENVKKDYNQYIKTNEIWDKVKKMN